MSNDDAAVRRFVQETGAPEAVARNALAIQNGNYVRAKQAYMNRTTTSAAAGNGVATLSSLSGGGGGGVSAKKRNELFAGGASSGIAQLGPAQDSDDEAEQRRTPGDVNELVAGVMDSARRQGAVDHSSMPVESDAELFGGQGRRLGDGGVSAAVPAKAKPNQVVISFYKNGFTTAVLPAGANVHAATDLGPLRRYDDPAQATFLESINQGRVPEEFRSLTKDGVVLDVSLVDKKSDDWSPPKGAAAAFTGHGQALGSSSASSSTATNKPPVAAAVAARALVVDESQPTTSLRVRLLDGKQIVVKCNQTHTIAQIRAHVDAEVAPSARYVFVCTSTRPPKRDLVESQTVKEADLLNATLHQQQQ